MKSSVVKVTAPEFAAAFDAQKAAGGKFICVFKGGIDPATNVSWCPDCVDAEPTIKKYIFDQAVNEKGIAVIECDVGQKAEWKNPDNVIRKHPVLKIQKVPAVSMIADVGVFTIYEEQCKDEDLLQTFLDD
eukprot:TRINITY_DN8128_c0_g2_i5.p1 TRINITY_DN8128_c0_g2~~TRINITY_DN8128_c0_g2_i5.p1  ORF type:complete len:131 (-),score=40.80 TRINITY_DN8128_c0_g2_i5:121-513(-)